MREGEKQWFIEKVVLSASFSGRAGSYWFFVAPFVWVTHIVTGIIWANASKQRGLGKVDQTFATSLGLIAALLLTQRAGLAEEVQKTEAPTELVRQIITDTKNDRWFQVQYGGDTQKYAAATDVETVDLNGDGTPEYLVTPPDACGSGGCSLLVYRRSGKGYEILFGSGADQTLTARKIEFGPGKNNAYVDMHLVDGKMLRFDGHRYHQVDEAVLKQVEQLRYPEARLPGSVRSRAELLFTGQLTDAYPQYGTAISAATDEFEKRDVKQRLGPEFTRKAEAEKQDLSAKVWLLRDPVHIGDYDFQRGFFRVEATSAQSVGQGVAFFVGVAIIRNSPFETESTERVPAAYRLALDETTAKEFRARVAASGPAEIEIAVRVVGYGSHPWGLGLSTKSLLAEAVAQRIVGKNGALTKWQTSKAEPVTLVAKGE